MNDTSLFAFESDFVATLRCIPMAVRFKLDRCAIKLSLRQWSRFNRDDRYALLTLACCSATEIEIYRARLVALVTTRSQEVAKPLPLPQSEPWRDKRVTPTAVKAFAQTKRVPPPSCAQWSALSELQRFVLVKLTRDNHDNLNFVPALVEFGLVSRRLCPAA
jgi:hypothetical protein